MKRAPALAVLWFALGFAYLAASLLGERRLAVAFFGLIMGAAVMAAGRVVPGAVAGLAFAMIFWGYGDAAAVLAYVPPLAVFAFMAWFFGRTLRPGRVPFIVRIARLEHPQLPPELERYARRVTLLWTVAFSILFAASAAMAFAMPFAEWARWSQALGYGVPAALFVGELAWRHHRYAHLRHGNLVELARNTLAAMRDEVRPAGRS